VPPLPIFARSRRRPSVDDDSGTAQAESTRLRDASIRGFRWVAAGRIVAEVTALASSVALARLLGPQQFGYAAIATVVYTVAVTLPASGVGNVLVRGSPPDTATLRTAFTASVGLGLLFSGLVAALGVGLTAALPGRVGALVLLAAPCMLLSAVGTVSIAMMQRNLAFRDATVTEVVGLTVGAVTAVAAVAAGAGVRGIVLGFLANTAVQSGVALYIVRPPRFGIAREPVRGIIHFGIPAALSTILFILGSNVDYAVLSVRVPATRLGLYFRAFQLGVDYQAKVSGVLLRMAFPLFSRAGSDTDIRRLRGKVVQLHTTLLFPCLALLMLIAPWLIPTVYGNVWRGAIVPTQILAVAGMATVVMTGAGPLLLALGRPRVLVWFSGFNLILLGGVVWAAAPHGLDAICVGVTAERLLAMLALQWAIIGPVAQISARELFVNDVAPPGIASAALVGVGVASSHALLAAGVTVWGARAGAVLLGSGAYLCLLRLCFPDVFTAARTTVARLLPHS
jgi:lipopolysaccharide exporter